MNAHTSKWQTVLGPARFNPALSEEAGKLQRVSEEATDFRNSASIWLPLQKGVDRLFSAFTEANEENWDGYGAAAANPKAVVLALRLLSQLPTTIPMPDMAIDVDGDVAFEWNYGPRRIVSVRVGGDGTIYYAGLLGYSTFYGSEIPSEGIPDAVAGAIDRILNAITRST